MAINKFIPIIDIFAGPGGLSEGFASYKLDDGTSCFKVKLSIEKDIFAHKTLELRAFFRQFDSNNIPSSYFDYLKGSIDRDELFTKYPKEAASAKNEAWLAELGKTDRNTVKSRIKEAIAGSKNWVLIGGPPCQAYSLVGRSRMRGENKWKYARDNRHFLYEEYLRILADHQPPFFIMENVKGLLSSQIKGENTFELITTDLKHPMGAKRSFSNEPLSYKLHSLIRNHKQNGELSPGDFIIRSEDYGIPQARHRIFILGVRTDVQIANIMSITRMGSVSIDDVIDDLPKLRSGLSKNADSNEEWNQAIYSIKNEKWFSSLSIDMQEEIEKSLDALTRKTRGSHYYPGSFVPKAYYDWYVDHNLGGVCNHQTRSHIVSDLHRYFFSSVFANVHGRSPTLNEFPMELLPNHKNVNKERGDSIFNDRFRVQVRGKPSTTIVSHISKDGHYYIHYDPSQCRSLTVREAARLQTFPDNYFFEGNKTNQYHQVGNAVPPMLANKIAATIYNLFEGLN
jgi:DNA (cytosine-5)-methyltransferase 1